MAGAACLQRRMWSVTNHGVVRSDVSRDPRIPSFFEQNPGNTVQCVAPQLFSTQRAAHSLVLWKMSQRFREDFDEC